ncbi:SMP-30/gluconolactonase/LRE family protein [Streptomyces sp. NPDC058646]|uniref:SMP-30/gluconolactonase/LRE family protein n=1 Tax=Streptomyces sp. NPDC058646 TaxID=3346574 RepID=UPI00366894D7
MAVDAAGQNMYVGNFDRGHIMRVPLDPWGQPGQASIVASGPAFKGADGLTLAEDGTLHVAVNTQNEIATISPHGTVPVMKLPDGVLNTPSSLVFTKDTRNPARDTLHIANFALQEFLDGLPPRPGIVHIPAPAVPGRNPSP